MKKINIKIIATLIFMMGVTFSCSDDFVDVKPGNPLYKNIGTGRPTSLREFAENYWNILERPRIYIVSLLPPGS